MAVCVEFSVSDEFFDRSADVRSHPAGPGPSVCDHWPPSRRLCACEGVGLNIVTDPIGPRQWQDICPRTDRSVLGRIRPDCADGV